MLPQIDSRAPAQEFTVTSGALRVTDPCYGTDVWCSGQIENVKNGKWLATVGYYKDQDDIAATEQWLAKYKAQREEFIASKKESRGPEFNWSPIDHDIARTEKSLAEYVGRVAYIQVVNAEHALDGIPELNPDLFEKVEGLDVGVDSGQAGFFDLAAYTNVVASRANHARGDEAFNSFYSRICHLTCESKESFGTVEFGAVSSSGYGDGGYGCYIAKSSDGQIIAAFILFISTEEDDDIDNAP